MGMGWGSADDGEGGSEMPVASDEELYMECVDVLTMECQEEEPVDPEEICTEEQLQYCTDLTVKFTALEENCEEYWEEVWEEEDDSEAPSEDVGDVDGDPVEPEGDTAGGMATGDGEAGSSGGGEEAPDTPTAAQEADPWDVAECCEELQFEPEMKEYMDCYVPLAEDDCDGALVCMDLYWGDEDEGEEWDDEDWEDMDAGDILIDEPAGDDDDDDDDDDAEFGGTDGTNVDDGTQDKPVEEEAGQEPGASDTAGTPTDTIPPDETPPDMTAPPADTAVPPTTQAPAPAATGDDEADDEDSGSDDGGCRFAPTSRDSGLISLIELALSNRL
jgi:hypothetical protein